MEENLLLKKSAEDRAQPMIEEEEEEEEFEGTFLTSFMLTGSPENR